MRKKILPIVAAGLCLFLSGCGELLSLFPLYSKDVMATDDNLVGRWEEHDKGSDAKKVKEECCWVFTKDGDGYALSVPNPDDKQTWLSQAHLARLGDALFVDLEPRSPKYDRTTEIGFPSVDVHMIFRVWIEKDAVRMAMLDLDGLKAAEASGETRLPFVNHKDDILVTATTEQLQAFFTEHANDKGLFNSDPDMLVNLTRKR